MKFLYSFYKIILVLLITGIGLFISNPVSGQQPSEGDLQKIESLKQSYISKQLNLSPKEAKEFWPLYKKYEKEMEQLSFKRKDNLMNKKELNKASEQQVKKSLDQDINIQQQVLQIRKRYKAQFMKILPAKKVMKLYKSEREFNTKLIEELGRRSDEKSSASKGGI